MITSADDKTKQTIKTKILKNSKSLQIKMKIIFPSITYDTW